MIRLSSANSNEILDPLKAVVNKVLLPHLAFPAAADIASHFAWMRAQKGQMIVNCKIETLPNGATLLQFILSFEDSSHARQDGTPVN